MQTFLFTSGAVTYGIIAPSLAAAHAFKRHTDLGNIAWRTATYSGVDTRTPKEQAKSTVIAVLLPEGWKAPR